MKRQNRNNARSAYDAQRANDRRSRYDGRRPNHPRSANEMDQSAVA
ncbi:MAG: hypothetical protein KDG51_17470 [Calditrichaeota bacterium]|nr:hypothetical protein [Calditrichota bacterium]